MSKAKSVTVGADGTQAAIVTNGTEPDLTGPDKKHPRGPDDLAFDFPVVTHKGLVTYEEDQQLRSQGKTSVAAYRDAICKASAVLGWLQVPKGRGFSIPIGAAGLRVGALEPVDAADTEAVKVREELIEVARLEGGILTEDDIDSLIPWEAGWVVICVSDYLDSLRELPKK